jgi:hypothetical protein
MKIYQNAFYVPSIDKFFCSWSTHDFVGHKFEDGREMFFDGGLSYKRQIGNFELLSDGSALDYTLFDDSPKELIYNNLLILLTKDRYVPISSLKKEQLGIVIQWFNKRYTKNLSIDDFEWMDTDYSDDDN